MTPRWIEERFDMKTAFVALGTLLLIALGHGVSVSDRWIMSTQNMLYISKYRDSMLTV